MCLCDYVETDKLLRSCFNPMGIDKSHLHEYDRYMKVEHPLILTMVLLLVLLGGTVSLLFVAQRYLGDCPTTWPL